MAGTFVYNLATSVMLVVQQALFFSLAQADQLARGVPAGQAGLHAAGVVFVLATLTGALRIPGNALGSWLSTKTDQRNLSTASSVARAAHAGAAAPRHAAASRAARPPATSSPPSARPSGDDALTREASLVAAARTALSGGNAEEALRLVRAARSMASPQLVPEELTVEAQALRSLGKADEARGVDATLHSQFPDSALAR